MKSNYRFKLYADCIAVKGASGNFIYDLGRRKYYAVPGSLFGLLNEGPYSIDEIKKAFPDVESLEIIDGYFDFLEKKELIYYIPQSIEDRFPPLENKWHYPSLLSNALINISADLQYNLESVILQLIDLDCLYLQFFSEEYIPIEIIRNVILSIKGTRIKSIEFIQKHSELQNDEAFKSLLQEEPRIKAIIFHTAQQNNLQNNFEDRSMGNFVFVTQKINNFLSYQNNSLHYMNVNHYLFFEAQNHHTYFNGKVAIDKEGNIKNCASHEAIFGNVKKDKIADVVNTKGFQELWFVKKDETEVCKDCEFRYMCVDSRIPKQISENKWTHEVECNYNPYTATWKNADKILETRTISTNYCSA